MIAPSERHLNIKDLVIDEPRQSRYFFRPQEEFLGFELEKVAQFVKNLQRTNKAWEYSQAVYQLTVLFGADKLPEKQSGNFEMLARNIQSHEVITVDKFIAERAGLAVLPAQFEPNSYRDVQLAQCLEMMQTDIEDHFAFSKDWGKLENLAAFRIIYPAYYKEFTRPVETRAKIVSTMSSFDDGIHIARNLRILFPDVKIDDVFTKPTLVQLRWAFDWYKSTNQWGAAIDSAYSLFLLTAQRIETNDGTLKVVVPLQPANEGIDMPVARRL